MNTVVTLIAAASSNLPDDIVTRVINLLKPHARSIETPDWLATNRACDIHLDTESSTFEDTEFLVRSHMAEEPVDIIVQSPDARKKKLLVADMDSTIVTTETLTDVAEVAGKGDIIDQITARTMRGELDFASSLRERVAMLEGLSDTALEAAYQRIQVSEGAEVLVRTMVAHGAYTALVSGGFTYFTSRIAKRLGFHENMANEFIVADGKLTGKVKEPILARNSKIEALEKLADDRGLEISETAAVGDGANDLDMIKAAGIGCAYRGKPLLRDAARVKLDYADLTGLLFAQGYRESEFAATSE
jgi:phosphoserine phosphatase